MELPTVDLEETDALPYFNLNEIPGVEELPREREANSRPIDIILGVPIADFVSHRLYVRLDITNSSNNSILSHLR